MLKGNWRSLLGLILVASLMIGFVRMNGPVSVSASVETGVYANPVPPGYGFINFEEGTDGQVIKSTLPGLNFTTTLGYDWVYSDVRTGIYNGRSLTDPSINYGPYVVNGYFSAWLGVNMGEGRIDFVNGSASYLSVLTSTHSGLSIDAYDSGGSFVATSGWAGGNIGTYSFTRLTVQAPNMAYVIIHDTGNYWLIDDLVTDAGGWSGLGPGTVYPCVQLSADPSSILETPAQSSRIVATVSDQLGNPWPRAAVHFTSSEGTLSSTSVETDDQGKASVSLTADHVTASPVVAVVTATANMVTTSTNVTMCPPTTSPPTSWKADTKVFQIQSKIVKLQQYLLPVVQRLNFLGILNSLIERLNSLPSLNVYKITKTSSATQTEFSRDLAFFFPIIIGNMTSEGYVPTTMYILEFPLEQLVNVLFNQNFQAQIVIPLLLPPAQAFLFDNAYIESTPSGSFNFALTFGRSSGLDAGRAIDLLSVIADSVTLLVKNIAASKPLSVIQNGIKAAVGYVKSIGDVDLGMITSDLDQQGALSSYSIIDLARALDRFSAATGIVIKIFEMLADGAKTMAGIATAYTGLGALAAIKAAKGLVLSVVDLGLEIIDLTSWASSFKDNVLYKILEAGVGWAATATDPDKTIIVPSVFDSSGSLVLGYNSSSSDVTYASSEGILIPLDGDWLAFLYENATGPMNYTICLNAVGGNGTVPYNLRILSSDENVTSVGYGGMVSGGTSLTIPVDVAPNGTLVQQVYLDPALSVRATGNIFDIVATGLLSNGSLASVTKSYLIINGSQYEMMQDNSSTFEIQTELDFPASALFFIYMISPGVPGGFASGVLPIHDVGVIGVLPYKTVIGQGYSLNTTVTVADFGYYSETFNATLHAENQTGLIGFWSLDEGSGTTAHDTSGNGNDGTLTNGPSWAVGKNGAALSFDGVDDRVEVLDSNLWDFGTGDFTMCAWINIRDKTKTMRIVSAGNGAGDPNNEMWTFGFWGTSSGAGMRINYAPKCGGYYRNFLSVPLTYNNYDWAHAAVVKNGTTISFYFDGVDVGSNEMTYPSNANSHLTIGARESDIPEDYMEFFDGLIDEVKIYNRVLSAQEIWTQYSSASFFAIGTQTVTLENGTSKTIMYAWNTVGLAYGNYAISSYVWPVQNETYTTDNMLVGGCITLTIPGDANGDGTVNILDPIIIGNSFLAKPGDSDWNPNADVDCSDWINILDSIVIGNHFLQHYP